MNKFIEVRTDMEIILDELWGWKFQSMDRDEYLTRVVPLLEEYTAKVHSQGAEEREKEINEVIHNELLRQMSTGYGVIGEGTKEVLVNIFNKIQFAISSKSLSNQSKEKRE